MNRLLLCIALLLVFPAISFAQSFDWPQWRGPNGDGTSAETGWNPLALKDGAKVLWNVNIGFGYSNVAIQGNRLYAMGLSEGDVYICCLDATTGRVIWRQQPFQESCFPQTTPAVAGESVYFLSSRGSLICVKASDGKVLWERDFKYDFGALSQPYLWASSPIVEGDLLLLSANGKALALDRRTGDLAWDVDVISPVSTSPRHVDYGVYATPVLHDFEGVQCALFLGPHTISAIESKTGRKVWSFELRKAWSLEGESDLLIIDPFIVEGNVFINGNIFDTSTGVLLDASVSPPSLAVKYTEAPNSWPHPVLSNGFLYGSVCPRNLPLTGSWGAFEQADHQFICMAVKSGEVMWRKQIGWSSSILVAGKLVTLELNGTLHIAEATPEGYRELSSADVLGGAKKARVFATPPVLCNGKIYCHNFAGELVCIDVSKSISPGE